MKEKDSTYDFRYECVRSLIAANDTIDVLKGKWKIEIISKLNYGGPLRFMDLLKVIPGIASKMLSKELRDLEINLLVKRTELKTKPASVEYELTLHGKTLERVINEMHVWGKLHRKKIMEK